MRITIQGRPVPAVRMTQRSKYKSKQAQRYLAYKDQIGWEAKIAGARLTHAPMDVRAKVFIDCTKRDIDIDNMAKAFLDGLNKIAWHDDRQVTRLSIEKFYVEEEGTEYAEIEIREVG